MKQEQRALLAKTSDALASALKALPSKCYDTEALLADAFDIHIKEKHLFLAKATDSRPQLVGVDTL